MKSHAVRTTPRALIAYGVNAAGNLIFTVKSASRKKCGHTIAVQPQTGRIHCTCEDFTHRVGRNRPTLD
ncbi:hypothetical protein C1X77_26285, partial [Pseudomonas sp. GW531-E2]|uniref:hypothetical protein n=1 Tax=Pseudomonas sp. GW531-E2 TaxID=2070679 RepID=UPI000CB786C4